MKLFKTYLTIQPNGHETYVILRGQKEHIRQTFNSLFNFGATNNSNLEYHCDTNLNSVAGFWSTWQQLQNYFYNNHFFKWEEHNKAFRHALNQINELKKEQNQESFLKLHLDKKPVVFDGFNFGTIENDEIDDIKDAILVESHKEKGQNLISQGNPDKESTVFPEKKNIKELLTVVSL